MLILLCLFLASNWGEIANLTRGQMRLTLSRDLAQYLVENDYRFPNSWNDFEEQQFVKRFGKPSGVKHNSVLNRKFILPWGESLTNDFVLTRVWFESIDGQRLAEDEAFTREVLFDVLSMSTNKAVNQKIICALESNTRKDDQFQNQTANSLYRFEKQNTNSMAGVEWIIVKKLEQTIDLQCALFLISLRCHYDEISDKRFLKKKLDDSSLGADNFCAELFSIFDMYNGLLVDEHSPSNALKVVLLTTSDRQERYQELLCRKTRLFQEPLPTNIVAYVEKSMDSLDLLSEDEKRSFMPVYAFFKGVFLQVYAQHFLGKSDPDRYFKPEDRDLYHKKAVNSQPTDAEIDFLKTLFNK